ncbi:MAG TPA: PfkB family carbohydrate kinase [Thermoplasmata archaeon]|nr:PfkB family carbohydrate kinase [Thermoplasmata archaeon]
MAAASGGERRPRDLLVSGHVNVDRFLRLPEFPAHDRTVPVEAHRVELGGTAGNIARTASRYGVVTGLVSRVGDDFPERFWDDLRSAHLDLRGVERVAGRPTPTAYILEDRRGRQRTLMDQGPMGETPRQFPKRPWLRQYSWLHLATGDPVSQLQLLSEGRRAGLRATADPGQEVHYRWTDPQLRRLLAGSEILFGNATEVDRVERAVGARTTDELLASVPAVVRTEGTRGATAYTRAGTIHVPARRPSRVRTVVGAGDSFRGGFYAAWFEGETLEDCLHAGTRAAARWLEGRR